MCEVCEGKAPLKTKISVSQKGNFLYSAEVKSGEMVFCATVQNINGPSFEFLKFECDFCPKCGRNLKLDGVAIGNTEELKKFGIDLKKHNPIGLYRGITTKKENKREFNETYVEGDLIHSGGKLYIHPVHNRVKVENDLGRIIAMHEVQPDTVTQI